MADNTSIRPFRVNVPDEDLAELQRRIAATRFPSKELVADRSQGVTALGRLITRRSQVQILPPPPTKMQVRPGAQAPGLLRVVPKLVPTSRIRVVSVVPHNPKVSAFSPRSAARSCRPVPVAPVACRSVPRVDRASGADSERRRESRRVDNPKALGRRLRSAGVFGTLVGWPRRWRATIRRAATTVRLSIGGVSSPTSWRMRVRWRVVWCTRWTAGSSDSRSRTVR